MKIVFIRHGMTPGNKKKRYIGGRTDEPLCEEGIEAIKQKHYPDVETVIISPMKRCLQTADIIYPEISKEVYEDLRECDFGLFEGKNYMELSDCQEYQEWIGGGGKAKFPQGDDPTTFKDRCTRAFLCALENHKDAASIAFVVHGGTIMAILERLAVPKKEFYEYHIENGGGFITEYDCEKLEIISKL